ncbi:MAG: glycosyltransferase, partial [Deltaproteobacteria bacterium]
MKIIQTPARFYPYIGGVEMVVYHLSRGLARAGHHVTVICADEPKGAPAEVEGIKVRRL